MQKTKPCFAEAQLTLMTQKGINQDIIISVAEDILKKLKKQYFIYGTTV